MRCGMTEDRLTSLALLHIQYSKSIDLDVVVDLFSKLHLRRLCMSNILEDNSAATIVVVVFLLYYCDLIPIQTNLYHVFIHFASFLDMFL